LAFCACEAEVAKDEDTVNEADMAFNTCEAVIAKELDRA